MIIIKKNTHTQKNSKFICSKVSDLIILVLVLQPPVLKTSQCLCSSSVVFSSWGKNKQKKKPKKIKNPKFKCNTVSVSPLASGVVVSSKEEGKKKKKRVWRQICECLSEAVAHLPPTVSHLLLQALFI
jgi:hypothetical protein